MHHSLSLTSLLSQNQCREVSLTIISALHLRILVFSFSVDGNRDPEMAASLRVWLFNAFYLIYFVCFKTRSDNLRR